MPIKSIDVISTLSRADHLAAMRQTGLLLDPRVRPFEDPAVKIYSERINPRDLAVTSKYVLKGQLRFMLEELFPKLIDNRISPFDMQGSAKLAVNFDDGSSSVVDFASPVCEMLLVNGEKVVAIADGMMRYTAARFWSGQYPNFKLNCTVIDATDLPSERHIPFYAAINDFESVQMDHALTKLNNQTWVMLATLPPAGPSTAPDR